MSSDDREFAEAIDSVAAADDEDIRPWELVEAGRYMPRRVRGSCRGRALG